MKISARVRIDGLRRKISRAKGELPAECEKALRELADDAVRLVQSAPEGARREFVARHLSRQFASVFAPVRLLGVRRERWPDLEPIYQARIVRGQRTFDGRKLFYVDERKESALFDALVRRAVEEREGDVFDVRFVRTYDRRFRVEIVRRGGGRVPPVVIAFAKQRMKHAGEEALRGALSKAGLR